MKFPGCPFFAFMRMWGIFANYMKPLFFPMLFIEAGGRNFDMDNDIFYCTVLPNPYVYLKPPFTLINTLICYYVRLLNFHLLQKELSHCLTGSHISVKYKGKIFQKIVFTVINNGILINLFN